MWKPLIKKFIQSVEWKDLNTLIRAERNTFNVYPPKSLQYIAFKAVDYNEVRVVLLGQDPYHGAGQANGLAFCVDKDIPEPPSLIRIHKVMKKTVNARYRLGMKHAKQGVLFLNTALTVREKEPGSHTQLWSSFTYEIISLLKKKKFLIWVLWGRKAQERIEEVGETSKHIYLKGPHPSPLAGNEFMECDHFKKINRILKRKSQQPIIW